MDHIAGYYCTCIEGLAGTNCQYSKLTSNILTFESDKNYYCKVRYVDYEVDPHITLSLQIHFIKILP